VSGTDAVALRSTMESLARESGLRVEPIPTSLEHAFIHLMRSAPAENGKGAAKEH
jgi:hypothetical protein